MTLGDDDDDDDDDDDVWRQKTNPSAEVGVVVEALGGDVEEGFSYIEAVRKSPPQLVGFSQASHRYDLDDHGWIFSHWKSASQKRKADMGHPMAVSAEMTEPIAPSIEKVVATGSVRSSKTDPTFEAYSSEDVWAEVIIDLIGIDIDALEKQPQMAFGNLVKKRA